MKNKGIREGNRKMKFYPIVVKIMSDEETKEYHLKRLERLCKESKGASCYVNPTRKRSYSRQAPFILWGIEFPGDTKRYDFE